MVRVLTPLVTISWVLIVRNEPGRSASSFDSQ